MPNIIKLKLSSVAAKAPLAADLIPGELAINVTDQILYSKDISGAIINVTGAPTSGSPNYIQNQSATTQAGTFKIASEGTVGQQLSVIGNGSTSTWNSLITLTAALPLRATGISIQNNNSWWLGTTYPSGLFQLRYKTGNWTSSTVRSDGTSDSNLMMSFDTAGAASFTSTIQATTAKLTNLTDGYIPYHISDISGLSNSPVYTNGTNVGIGTISLGAKFEVDGMTLARVTNFNSTHANGIYSTWSNSGSIIGDLGSGKSVVTGNFSDFALNVRGANNLVFGINSVEKVRINSSGNLGIGTTSPSQKLEVNSSTEIKGYFHGTHGGSQGIRVQRDFGDSVDLMANYTGWGGGLASSSALRFSVNGAGINGTPAMYINTIGNVGIGTTLPTATLHLKAGTATAGTAPLKFTAGPYMTVPEAGTIQYNTGEFKITDKIVVTGEDSYISGFDFLKYSVSSFAIAAGAIEVNFDEGAAKVIFNSSIDTPACYINGVDISTIYARKSIENAYTQQQYFEIATLTYATTINWNCRTAQKAKVTLTGNASIANPTLVKDGATYTLRITQDSIGGRILTWGANFNWGDASAPVLSTAPNKTDILSFEGDGTNLLFLGIRKGF